MHGLLNKYVSNTRGASMKRIAYIAGTLAIFSTAAVADGAQHPPTMAEWPGIANEILIQKNALQNRTIELAQENAGLKADLEAARKEVAAFKAKYEPKTDASAPAAEGK